MARLTGKVAVITGAASGFGEGMAKRFAEEGARVVVADLNSKGAERVAGEIGSHAIAVGTDVSQRSEVEAMVAAAMDAFGRIDIMVNNAGFTHRNGDMLGVDEDTFDLIAAVNMRRSTIPRSSSFRSWSARVAGRSSPRRRQPGCGHGRA